VLNNNDAVKLDVDKMKKVHLCLIDAMNSRDISMVDDLFTEEYIVHEGFDADLKELCYTVNREMLCKSLGNPIRGIPDKKVTVDFQIAENNMIMTYCTANATHSGTWAGVKASGRKVKYTNVFVSKLNSDYKIIEHWIYFDAFGAFRQIGALN